MKRFTPMLATIGSELPSSGDWVFEPKYDGIRILAFVDGRHVSLISRNGIDKTRQFPEVADALRALHAHVKRPFVLDSEIVATHRAAPARFQALQSRMHVTDQRAIEEHREKNPVALMAFDLLLDGKDTLVKQPWHERRERLEALFEGAPRMHAVRLGAVGGSGGAAMLRKARQRGWEGVIAKRRNAKYDAGHRSRAWLKLKIERQQEFVIGGWTEPRRSREYIGAILLGYYDADGELIYAGHTGTGFTRESLRDVHRLLSRVERKTSPFATKPETNEAAHWVRPVVVAEIKFNEWTSDGRLRQPVFLGIRTDKPPKEVIREPESLANGKLRTHGRVRSRSTERVAASTIRSRRRRKRPEHRVAARSTAPTKVLRALSAIEESGGSGTLTLPTGTLEVSNLDKVFFPSTGHTKGDVMRYYATVARMILPAIADRPLVMKRFPNGVRGKSFYQQRAPEHTPDSVRVETVSDVGYAAQRKLIGGDLATLLYSVQLGAISVDPWHSRQQSVRSADYAILDLDPGPRAPFARVVDIALAVKAVLDRLKLHAVPKTSGASGLHIVLPLGARVSNDGARALAQFVAKRVADEYPKLATVVRSVGKRGHGTIYVDYLQNIRGKTVAGVYSVRAQATPTVSTPLDWDEVAETLDPTDLTIDSVPGRLRDVGDLWAKAMRRPNSLKAITTDA